MEGVKERKEEKYILRNEHAALTVWPAGIPLDHPDHCHHQHHHLNQYEPAPGPRFSFISNENTSLGIFDTSTIEFRGKLRGKAWKTTMAEAVDVQVIKSNLGCARVPGLDDFGPEALTLEARLPEIGQVCVDFVLHTIGPSMVLRLRCPALACSHDVRLDEFVLFDGDCDVSQGPRRDGKSLARIWWEYLSRRVRGLGPRRVFVNGWNAWSFTGVVQQGARPSAPGLPGILSAAFHHGAGPAEFDRSNNKELYSEMFAHVSDKSRGTGLLLGFLTQHEQFGAFSFDECFVEVGAHCRCDGQLLKAGELMQSDWCLVELQTTLPEEPFATFIARAGRVNTALLEEKYKIIACRPDTKNVPVGWCSWYHFYEAISEDNLLSNLEMMANLRPQLPLQLFQIDDGYQRAWGDWLKIDPLKFPNKSMRDIVDAVRSRGLRPGLWLAPMAVDKHSQIAADHPDWIIRQQGGLSHGWAANSANVGKWFYGLDVTLPEVQAFIRETLTTVSHGAWSFDYLKLDFLYVAALKGARSDPTLNTAQVLQLALRLIREAVGTSTYILGCGSPLGATIGWVNANRVSADAGPAWLPVFPLPDCKWNLPCGRNMVRNTINRLPMHGVWWVNDPDCMLLRESTQFTPAEVIGIATVKALSGGSFLVSDDLQSVSHRRMRIAQVMLPVIGRAAIALDLLEREMPEILRLYVDQDSFSEETSMCHAANTFFSHHVPQDPWVVVGFCNWDDAKKHSMHPYKSILRPLLVDVGPVIILHIFEFWTSKYFQVRLNLDLNPDALMSTADFFDGMDGGEIQPHSARLYAMRVDPRQLPSALTSTSQGAESARGSTMSRAPLYLGSDVHFSCGWELRKCIWGEESDYLDKAKVTRVSVHVVIDAGKVVDGTSHHIWLDLPGSEDSINLDGAPEGSERVNFSVKGIYEGLEESTAPSLPTLFSGKHRSEGALATAAPRSPSIRRTVWKIRFPEGHSQRISWTLNYISTFDQDDQIRKDVQKK